MENKHTTNNKNHCVTLFDQSIWLWININKLSRRSSGTDLPFSFGGMAKELGNPIQNLIDEVRFVYESNDSPDTAR